MNEETPIEQEMEVLKSILKILYSIDPEASKRVLVAAQSHSEYFHQKPEQKIKQLTVEKERNLIRIADIDKQIIKLTPKKITENNQVKNANL